MFMSHKTAPREISRAVNALWTPARIACLTWQAYWETWNQVFRYPSKKC